MNNFEYLQIDYVAKLLKDLPLWRLIKGVYERREDNVT